MQVDAGTEKVFKVCVNIPEGFMQEMMDAVTESIEPLYPGYDRCFYFYGVTGTWRPLPGSHPYDGEVGKVQTSPEMRVEFAVREEFLERALKAVLRVHPYEEPAIDVIPMIGWRSVIRSDGT